MQLLLYYVVLAEILLVKLKNLCIQNVWILLMEK